MNARWCLRQAIIPSHAYNSDRSKWLRIRESTSLKKGRQRTQRKQGKIPFSALNLSVHDLADEGRWAANSLPVDYGRWLIRIGADDPHQGLVWYSNNLNESYGNARAQAALGNIEAAMYHAFRAGALFTELDMRLVHGETFEKYESVQSAQRDAAYARKVVPDETRRAVWWRFRREGHKRAEAGRLAGKDLGLSEASIRNAFAEGRYPD